MGNQKFDLNPGIAASLGERLEAGLRSGLLRDLHGVVAAQGGSVLIERYFIGRDEAWGRDLGEVTFSPSALHDLRSVTKSVVALLYGIALGRGLVADPQAPLRDQFPDYAGASDDERAARQTVAHALSMTLGQAWDENRPYTDAANSEVAMELSDDRLRFVLEQPFTAEPGAAWIYSGGAYALVGAMIERGTGMTLPAFAVETLFAPLGIDRFEWATGADSRASAASGLRLALPDLARIGRMVLDRGMAGGREIVPRAWLERALQPIADLGDGLVYGLGWFGGMVATADGQERRWWAGFGNGGQRLWLMPEADLVMASFSGAYNRFDAWMTPARIWCELVVPFMDVAAPNVPYAK